MLQQFDSAFASANFDFFDSIDTLQSAIERAKPGAVLVLANGEYLDARITINRDNLTIRAESPGKVIFTGDSRVVIKGNGSTFNGFQFVAVETPGVLIRVLGNENKLIDINFLGVIAEKYINLEASGVKNEVLYCNFENKPERAPRGNLVGVIPNKQFPGFHKIRFCSFKNLPGTGGDFGNEPIRIGLGEKSEFISRTLIESCYWENTGSGDSENISIKCRENVVRYCTFRNNTAGMLVFRNGNDNMAYGNYFFNAGGIRVKEASNIFCFSNYFENSGNDGEAHSVILDYVPGHLRNVNFLFNSFINCAPISLGTDPSVSSQWSNNIFANDSGSIFADASAGTKWRGNQFQGSLGIKRVPGLDPAALHLVRKFDGFRFPTSKSNSRAAAVTGFTRPMMYEGMQPSDPLSFDFSRKARPKQASSWDVGALQYSRTPSSLPVVTSANTGPRYL